MLQLLPSLGRHQQISFVMLITAVLLVQGKGMVCCVRPDIPFHVEHPFLSEQQARFFLGFVCLWGFVCFVYLFNAFSEVLPGR